MHLAAFGVSPEAIDVPAIEATVAYHLASLDTSATMVRQSLLSSTHTLFFPLFFCPCA